MPLMQIKLDPILRITYEREEKRLNIRYESQTISYHHVPLFYFHELLMSPIQPQYLSKYIHPYYPYEVSSPQ
ncbi:KTSC domain-containing protein [Exiguobacterium sp. s140]|uniref:KTSC domain-containing protein n=2 Tax=unclassified Exiguobacterium TaxID=2644629 RepID=UPI001BEC4160|nr:KTSC domain-containing protein [Exiguobacterium sp. s140]